MIATVNSQVLAAELRLLNKIVPTKPAIAILSHVLLSADPAGLRLRATDLEISLSATCPATASDGSVALPVARLLALVEQFPDADISIEASAGAGVLVKCGAFKLKLQAMAVVDFPREPEAIGASSALDGASMRRMIACTRYAINSTSSKALLQGALLTLSGGVAAMVATDGKRLALATAGRKGDDVSMVIPVKALDALGQTQGDVEVTVGARHLHFAAAGRMLTSRTIEGQYPAYERIIPRDNDKHVVIDRLALASALRRVVLVSESNSAVYFNLDAGKIILASRSTEVGTADEEVQVQYDGPPLRICVNGNFVLDFLSAAVNGTVTLSMKDATTAMLLTDGDSHVAVIMLMRG